MKIFVRLKETNRSPYHDFATFKADRASAQNLLRAIAAYAHDDIAEITIERNGALHSRWKLPLILGGDSEFDSLLEHL